MEATVIALLQSGEVAKIVPTVIQQHLHLAMTGQQAKLVIIVSCLANPAYLSCPLLPLSSPHYMPLYVTVRYQTAGQLITQHAFLLGLLSSSQCDPDSEPERRRWLNKHMLQHT